ncbi:MAG TPA: tyrosine-protein phosphatase [Pyrinomonadaceae bacterium]|jgi:protein tyrosine/serine phosphatase|nr:tyrosine-protein phosphatase [Pyrinomonadaceae bacterium]
MKRVFRTSLLTLVALVSFATIASAQTSPSNFPGISIHNFGQMADNLYRGAQPSQSDYKALADFGIRTIIDLRNDSESYAKSAAESAGLKYYNIPMNGVSAPSDEDVAQFLKIINDPASGKVYFHCKAGIHRAGTMGAVYRINHDGWDFDKAFAEMKNYQFSAGMFHGGLQSFVKKYAQRTASDKAATTTRAAAATPAVSN